MPRVEIPELVSAEVGQATAGWEAVDRGLLCFFWGMIVSLGGAAFLALMILAAANLANSDFGPTRDMTALLTLTTSSIGGAAMVGGGFFVLLGVCLWCASPQTSARTLAIVCLATVIMTSYVATNSAMTIAQWTMMDFGWRRGMPESSFMMMLAPVNTMGLIAHVGAVAFLYLIANYFGQKLLSKQIFAYAIYQVAMIAAVALMFSVSMPMAANAESSYTGMGSETWFYVFIMELVIGATLVLIGMMWFLRVVHTTRHVVRSAVRHAVQAREEAKRTAAV